MSQSLSAGIPIWRREVLSRCSLIGLSPCRQGFLSGVTGSTLVKLQMRLSPCWQGFLSGELPDVCIHGFLVSVPVGRDSYLECKICGMTLDESCLSPCWQGFLSGEKSTDSLLDLKLGLSPCWQGFLSGALALNRSYF